MFDESTSERWVIKQRVILINSGESLIEIDWASVEDVARERYEHYCQFGDVVLIKESENVVDANFFCDLRNY